MHTDINHTHNNITPMHTQSHHTDTQNTRHTCTHTEPLTEYTYAHTRIHAPHRITPHTHTDTDIHTHTHTTDTQIYSQNTHMHTHVLTYTTQAE